MEELVEKAKNRIDGAFDELILLIEKEMYLIAKSRLKNDDDIADAIQETILICFKNIRKLKNNNFFKTWSIRILINECNKIYKKKKREMISLDEKEIEITDENYDDSNLSFQILIENLKEEEKTILTMYYCFQYTTKEISNILNINENTVKSKIVRAKEKLKNKFGGEKTWKI
ncbi:MAG: RNA polymerase sigma factor [Clostridia bacterium]|nr:RNA polymerase sigma factor [Clostridia bacterium]